MKTIILNDNRCFFEHAFVTHFSRPHAEHGPKIVFLLLSQINIFSGIGDFIARR